jgi:predicted ATPase
LGWPKRIVWLEISGLRGWTGQRVDFNFPIVAVIGENGSGKSTVLQSAASVYKPADNSKPHYPTDYFPDTPWDSVTNASIKFSYREGESIKIGDIRKPTERWRGYSDRPQRHVEYIDLSRVQPVAVRTGYQKLANPNIKESSSVDWDDKRVGRLSQVMGRKYDNARLAATEADDKKIHILKLRESSFSGFHQGAGETTIAELLQANYRSTGLILIDEIETSLHPRVQRRLIRDLAEQCRNLDLQVIITTHSPYILEELPPEARIYIINENAKRTIVSGVSPEFAMTKMDEETHPECDIFVEDNRAGILLKEIMVYHKREIANRCQFISFGAASVGYSLGQMAMGNRFPRPSLVFLDGDQESREGCLVLPGGDAPERVVFGELQKISWADLSTRLSRSFSEVADACQNSMAYSNPHEWVALAGDRIMVSGDILWHAMCGCWAKNCLDKDIASAITTPIEDALNVNGPARVTSIGSQLPF